MVQRGGHPIVDDPIPTAKQGLADARRNINVFPS
jgi:hypothetical protein